MLFWRPCLIFIFIFMSIPTMSRVALDHLVGGFEASCGDISHSETLVSCLVSTQDRGVGHQREVDPGKSGTLESGQS